MGFYSPSAIGEMGVGETLRNFLGTLATAAIQMVIQTTKP